MNNNTAPKALKILGFSFLKRAETGHFNLEQWTNFRFFILETYSLDIGYFNHMNNNTASKS